MSNTLEKFKNGTHFKVNPMQKHDNLLRQTPTLFHLFLKAQNTFQGASPVVTLHLVHCLLPFCSTPGSPPKTRASVSLEETEVFAGTSAY